MSRTASLYWIHVLTSTHVGTGRGVGYIDLPIHRDKTTGWPLVPSSAFKGVWADYHRATDGARKDDARLRLAFGRAGDDSSNAGALVPTDARLVCLPVRSFQGTFAWCTSRMALNLLRRDLELAGFAGLPNCPGAPPEGQARVTDKSILSVTTDATAKIYLEDLDFNVTVDPDATAWATRIGEWIFPDDAGGWRAELTGRFAVLPDAVFDFLCETGTEVHARVRISDETKTVEEGPWYEEALPAETLLAGLVLCDRVYDRDGKGGWDEQKLLGDFARGRLNLQIGGKATVGRGQIECVFVPKN